MMILVLQAPIRLHVAAFSSFAGPGAREPSRGRERRLILARDGLRQRRGGRHRLTPLAYPHIPHWRSTHVRTSSLTHRHSATSSKPTAKRWGRRTGNGFERDDAMRGPGEMSSQASRRGGKVLGNYLLRFSRSPFKLAQRGSPIAHAFVAFGPTGALFQAAYDMVHSRRRGTPGGYISSLSSPAPDLITHPVKFDDTGKMQPHLHQLQLSLSSCTGRSTNSSTVVRSRAKISRDQLTVAPWHEQQFIEL